VAAARTFQQSLETLPASSAHVDGNACALRSGDPGNPGDQVSRLARVAALEAAGRFRTRRGDAHRLRRMAGCGRGQERLFTLDLGAGLSTLVAAADAGEGQTFAY